MLTSTQLFFSKKSRSQKSCQTMPVISHRFPGEALEIEDEEPTDEPHEQSADAYR